MLYTATIESTKITVEQKEQSDIDTLAKLIKHELKNQIDKLSNDKLIKLTNLDASDTTLCGIIIENRKHNRVVEINSRLFQELDDSGWAYETK